MSPHFRKAVAEIDQDIAKLNNDIIRLQTTRQTIADLYGGDTELPAPPPRRSRETKTSCAAGAPVSRPARPDPVPATTPSGYSRAPSADTIALMAVARTMPEPISPTTLAVASGKKPVFCRNNISRWAAKGWLGKTGYGEYKRTSTFPIQA